MQNGTTASRMNLFKRYTPFWLRLQWIAAIIKYRDAVFAPFLSQKQKYYNYWKTPICMFTLSQSGWDSAISFSVIIEDGHEVFATLYHFFVKPSNPLAEIFQLLSFLEYSAKSKMITFRDVVLQAR